jgi:hypothetical protein
MSDHFISHLKSKHQTTWQTLVGAANDGLVFIDEENDAVTATNRLLFAYPGLHEALQRLTDEWAERHVDVTSEFKKLISHKNSFLPSAKGGN